MNIIQRPRRLRLTPMIRELVQETHLGANNLVWPAFIKEGQKIREPISSLSNCFRFSLDELLKELEKLKKLDLYAVALFPCIDDSLKNKKASEALNPKGLVPKAVREIKKHFPDLIVITDVALDPYSSDGHDGLVKDERILNDESVIVLAEQALLQADCGSDFVAPSDMMDGRVGWIRSQLDDQGFQETGIISYTAKYASSFYGPFRDALASAPRFGDKKTYQMNSMNSREALREAKLDTSEGADILLVKPALSYLDIISLIKRNSLLPVAAYNVSGEYAMVKAAAQNGWLDEKQATLEILGSIRRAGAQLIFTYHCPDVLNWLKDSR